MLRPRVVPDTDMYCGGGVDRMAADMDVLNAVDDAGNNLTCPSSCSSLKGTKGGMG